ncbi:MAG: hypothetical protein Q7S85_04460 [Rugosibacter sp.]|nr:hypothetical protein [Rugosibacter sp.]
MISPRSILLSCCLAAVLLLSVWVSGAQDLWTQDVLENGDIVLTLDADAHADDSFEQLALVSDAPSAIFVPLNASYPQQLARAVLSDSFPPPDRPPAESV